MLNQKKAKCRLNEKTQILISFTLFGKNPLKIWSPQKHQFMQKQIDETKCSLIDFKARSQNMSNMNT